MAGKISCPEKQSNGKSLLFAEPVSGVSITSTPSEILEGDITTLTCSAAKGSEVSFFWFKGDQILESDDRVSLSNDSRVLTFNTTIKQDLGVYTCLVKNSASSSNDSHTLNVFYGPDDVNLNGGLVGITMGLGSSANLFCIADSNPPAQFRWFFNYSDTNVTRSFYSMHATTWDDAGYYMCMAYNNRTKRTGTATVTIKLRNDPPYSPSEPEGPERSGLGPGAIAGIVVGSLALGLALVGGLLYFFLRIRPQRKKPTSDPIQSGPPAYDNVSRPGQRTIGSADAPRRNAKGKFRLEEVQGKQSSEEEASPAKKAFLVSSSCWCGVREKAQRRPLRDPAEKMGLEVAKKISCSAKESIWKDFLIAVPVLSFCFFLAGARVSLTDITVEPENPTRGGSVLLTPTRIPENKNSCLWYRGEESPQNLILEYSFYPSFKIHRGDGYTRRENIDPSCSLQIVELERTDSGTYSVKIVSAHRTVKREVDLVVSALSPGVTAVIVIVMLALGSGLIGGLLYFFLRIHRQRRKLTLDRAQSATATYENLPRPGLKAAEENPEVSSDPTSNVYEALQNQSPCVYEEIKLP
nr:carcinoembryonic antigen-related cell adhesion molecule 6-like [Anolis sagrei ordinatus]